MYRVVPRHDACQEVFGICGPARRGIYSKKHFVESEILFWCFQKQSTSFFGFFFGVNGFVRNKNPVAKQSRVICATDNRASTIILKGSVEFGA
jgi:hypothetical protein